VVVLANSDPPIPELAVTEFARRIAQIYLYARMEPQTLGLTLPGQQVN
jgi:hypothetical protein